GGRVPRPDGGRRGGVRRQRPLRAALLSGRPPAGPSSDGAEWASCVEGLRSAGDLAASHGVVLAIEPLNRVETHFLNTVDDAVALPEEVGHPSVALPTDTFHMNIEEKEPPAAIGRGARHTRHVHFSENDRGTVGSGHVDWAGVARALRAIDY